MENRVVISRKDAKAAGLKRYFTGKPCPYGHVVERVVSSKQCVSCHVELIKRQQRYHIKNKTPIGLKMLETNFKSHRRYLLKTYGLTESEHREMLEKQGGVCAICRNEETRQIEGQRKWELSVDHDHNTRRVRGLLCSECNKSLGFFERQRHEFEEYLRRHNEEERSPDFLLSFAVENGAVPI